MKTLNKILLSLVLVFAGFVVSFGQEYSVHEVHTVEGLYSFSLMDDYPPENYSFYTDGVTWNFGDGSGSVTGSSNIINHQYTASGTYNVFVDITGPNVSTKSFLSVVVVLPMECPKIVFLPVETECGSGNVSISLAECSNSSNAQLEHVTWDMGDGSLPIVTEDLNINYTYTESIPHSVSATATYLLANGLTCDVNALALTGSPQDYTLSEICGSTSTNISLYLPMIVFSGYLSVSPNSLQSCVNESIILNYTSDFTANPSTEITLFIDGVAVSTSSTLPTSGSSIYSGLFTEGQHVVEYFVDNKGRNCNLSLSLIFDVNPCDPPCEDCFTFKPEPGKRYWVSAWVKEEHPAQVLSYVDAAVQIEFNGSTGSPVTFHTTGEIIDGWQRIVGDFTIPVGTNDIDINLMNNGGAVDAYFDDIRIHPFNASMKSYVYDPITFLLTAELDDNNYATFYEYDKEGQLIRIKKETARGIMTIQESRSSNPKEQ